MDCSFNNTKKWSKTTQIKINYSPDTLLEGWTLTFDGWTLGLEGWTLAFDE